MPPKSLSLTLSLSALSHALISSDGITGRVPAMGWNSWNEYACDINETIFLTVAERLISLGLADLGYNYVNIDDCWSDKEKRRDNVTGRLLPDYSKFPKGIKGTADEIHGLGLKLGIYGDAGTATCGTYEGSLGHEEIDAKTWAEWGVDYLKYDNCFVPDDWKDDCRWFPANWLGGPPLENQSADANGLAPNLQESDPGACPPGYDWTTSNSFKRYAAMRDALLATNRTIQFSQCIWGHAHVDLWGNSTGHSWRMFDDINPVWHGKPTGASGIAPILNHASFFTTNTTNFWGHGDWDMLEVGNGDLTFEENRSHFALWAALKSPLIIGTKLESITPDVLSILSNRALIAFNQDSLVGAPAKPYKWGINPDFTWNETHPAEFWAGESSTGVHVFVLNTIEEAIEKEVVFNEVPGLNAFELYTVHDLWTGEQHRNVGGGYKAVVQRHDTLALRIVKAGGIYEQEDRWEEEEL